MIRKPYNMSGPKKPFEEHDDAPPLMPVPDTINYEPVVPLPGESGKIGLTKPLIPTEIEALDRANKANEEIGLPPTAKQRVARSSADQLITGGIIIFPLLLVLLFVVVKYA
jgi:hypothetical protein